MKKLCLNLIFMLGLIIATVAQEQPKPENWAPKSLDPKDYNPIGQY